MPNARALAASKSRARRTDMQAPLPFLTRDLPPVGGVFRATPEDFVVEEVPAYLPCGDGDHLFVLVEKTGLTTPEAVQRIARGIGSRADQAGWAGLKDKHARTVQWVSFLFGDEAKARALDLPGIRILDAKRHRNRLKAGHLHGNRFTLTLRECHEDALARASVLRDALRTRGVPNYYGQQRFGRDGDNAERARAWLTGGRAPRDGFERKMLASALQSSLFNQYVAERLTDDLLDQYVPGDLAVRHPIDRWFRIEPAEAAETFASGACSATGPMFGPEMTWPEPGTAAHEREARVLTASGLTLDDFARARDLARGTRRPVRLVQLGIEIEAGGLKELVLRFQLPAGAYATTLLREFRHTDDETPRDRLQNPGVSGIDPAPGGATSADRGPEPQPEE